MLLTLCTALLLGPVPHQLPRPRLVVLIAIDQMRGDYLDRYRSQWTGAFKDILEHGAFFPNARQDHAVTETAPGFSTLLSGRTPAHTGIVNNTYGVADSSAPLLGTAGPGASPRRFLGSSLADWLLSEDSTARLLSISRKDRSAILPLGRARGKAYWFSGGRFTTSRYYEQSLPAWVTAYNDRRGAERLAGKFWNLLRPVAEYAETDSMPYEHGGRDLTFPHKVPADSSAAVLQIPDYPWMDSLTLGMALEGVRAMQLGTDQATDLLAVSLSATDAIGHAYGPDSRELHDQLLRLDHWIGWFLDSLALVIPPEEVVFVLSGDHGVQSFPEFTRDVRHLDVGRVSLKGLTTQLGAELEARYHSSFDIQNESGLLTANVVAMRARGINIDSLSESYAAEVRRLRGVTRVLTPVLLEAAAPGDSIARLWRRQIPQAQGWIAAAALAPGFIWADSDGWTTHGSLDAQDMSVPIVFWGAGVKPGRNRQTVSTVDIAPTLAALIGIHPAEQLDGQVLGQALARQPAKQ